MDMRKVKAVQDDSGHWYVIPNEMESKFYELDEKIGSENEIEATEADDEFSMMFSQYMTGGDLNLIQLYADIN